ncbi:MAG: hypothetical protein K5985_09805 [Lachnospiraceae bacterium]|nr:hypothetical protein [Lachnospiraceae bacterium]
MLVTLDEAIALIKSGKFLHIAGDEALLDRLPEGNWIGGTTAFFMASGGGVFTKEKLYVDEFDFAEEMKVAAYGKYNVFQLVEDCYENGLNVIIMPYGSEVVSKYSKEAPEVEELLLHPTIGWVSGLDLNGDGEAKAYDGTTGKSYTDKAVVMFLKLPEGKAAQINLINIFEDDKADPVITFPESSLSVESCLVDGQELNFADYIDKKGIDSGMPLVADYNGVYLNISIKGIENGRVDLYAPVIKNIEYRFAARVEDYEKEFLARVNAASSVRPVLCCNCIINYLNGNLEGKKIPPFLGPVTFGEVAYQLLNQTLVYCEIV